MERQLVNLSNLSGGAANDFFDEAMNQVIDNIKDVNTPPRATRTITLTLKIKPSEDRLTAETELSVKTTLPPIKPFAKSMFFGRDKDGIHAYEQSIEQQVLPFPQITKEA